jgi:methyl-accepting chemotaxis protein
MLLGREFTGQLDPTQCALGKWYYATKPPAELEATFAKIEEPHRRLHGTAGKIIGALKEGRHDAARTLYEGETLRALGETQALLEELRVGAKKLTASSIDAVESMQAATTKTTMVAYAIVLVGFLAAAVVFLARPIRRNVGRLLAMFEALGRGDLTARARVDTQDELGQLARAANAMAERTEAVLHEVDLAAGHVAVASQQLSAAASEISRGAQEQASALEESAASLEEITATVRHNTDNAGQANQLAGSSRDVAETGGQVVKQTVAAMSEISEASRRIADIIGTIDEIAFQTNLLALNAAVEAARAGEQGRGFAVVAAEVRNLAQRAATAAREIKALIHDSLGKVASGGELVNRSGQTLEEIVSSANQVAGIVADIAAASREQATGIEQVNKAVTQMDQVTQTNAAQTEELSSTAQALTAQAEHLQSLVARFTLAASGPSAGAPSREQRIGRTPPERSKRFEQPVRGPERVLVAAGIPEGAATTRDAFEDF